MSQDEYFFKVLKLKSVLYVYAPTVSKFFWCLVIEKMEIQVFACFKMLFAAFRKPPLCKLFRKPETRVKTSNIFEAGRVRVLLLKIKRR